MIHTDFERGFIRAETIAYDDYVALGGEAGARDAGKLRLEGKEYVVADGDVMHFTISRLSYTRPVHTGRGCRATKLRTAAGRRLMATCRP